MLIEHSNQNLASTMRKLSLASLFVVLTSPLAHAVSSQTYTWNNVKIGGGGGFVPNIIFNPTEKGLAYARTDIGISVSILCRASSVEELFVKAGRTG